MTYKKEVIASQNNLKLISKTKDYIIVKAKFGPSKEIKIPLKLGEDLAFFAATIIGDGHLKKDKFQITIELTNYQLLQRIKDLCLNLFGREFNISPESIRPNKKPTRRLMINSKSIYNLLNKVFEIQIGKKSHIVSVPKIVLNSNRKIKTAFLQGIMLTEGGKRHRGYGLSTASENLWKGLIQIFSDINIPIQKDKWVHKKYKKTYYGISFKKEYLVQIMGRCQSGQMGYA